jgi:hypothetical protein
MMSPSSSPHFTVIARLLALVALVGMIAAAILFSGSNTAQSADAPTAAPQPADPTVYVQPPPETVADREAAFERHFAKLREPGGDSIPATSEIHDAALDVGGSRQLSSPSATRLASEGAEQPDATVWVTPRADGSQCLLAQLPESGGPSQACAMPEQAVDGYFVMTQSRDDTHAEIYGLMPDGVERVTVRLADGTTSTLPVVENAYMAQYEQMTLSISWQDPNGVEHSLRAGSGA